MQDHKGNDIVVDTPGLAANGAGLPKRRPEKRYRAYIGARDQYDFMGATQFRLLSTLGLREGHKLLDFGCGSLRAGRLLIPYLAPGNYFGLEPNRWLIEDATEREIGHDLIRIKHPVFRYDTDFMADHFGVKFNFIIAQSIFSHAGSDIIATALDSFRRVLEPTGLVVATFVNKSREEFTGRGWVYPECVNYRRQTVLDMIGAAKLFGRPLPWFHPRQTWYALAHTSDQLPSEADDAHLSGAVLRDPEFARGRLITDDQREFRRARAAARRQRRERAAT